jgi:hypothetical protein
VLSSIHNLFYDDFKQLTHIYSYIDLDGTRAGPAHTIEAPKSNSRGIGGIFEQGGPEERRRILSQ